MLPVKRRPLGIGYRLWPVRVLRLTSVYPMPGNVGEAAAGGPVLQEFGPSACQVPPREVLARVLHGGSPDGTAGGTCRVR